MTNSTTSPPIAHPQQPKILDSVQLICGWPTDLSSIDYYDYDVTKSGYRNDPVYPHTIIMFVPGNPGCIGWYDDMLYSIVQQIGAWCEISLVVVNNCSIIFIAIRYSYRYTMSMPYYKYDTVASTFVFVLD